MLHRPQLLHQGSSCRASASCCSSRRGLVCYRPARCTAISRQQLQVQCTGSPMDGSGPPPSKPGNDQKGAPPSLPKDPKTPANTSWQISKQASSPTGPGSAPNKPILGARNPPANPNTTTTTTTVTTTTSTSGAANTSSQPQPSTPASPGSQASTGANPPQPTPGATTGPPPPSPGMGTGPQPSSAQSNTTTTTTTTTTVTYTTSTAPTSTTTTQLSPTHPGGTNSPGLIDWGAFDGGNQRYQRRPGPYGAQYSQQPGSGLSSQKAPKMPQGSPPAPPPPKAQAPQPTGTAPPAPTGTAPVPAGRTRRELGGSYNLAVTSDVAVRFMLQGINTLTRLPLAALLCGDPTTVRWFLMLFPVFMHESLVLVHKDNAAPTTLSVACVVAADPANVQAQGSYKLCSAPWTVNYLLGSGMSFDPKALGASQKADGSGSYYAWVARTRIVARCLQLLGGTVTDAQLRTVVSNNTLVLDAYALEAPDTKLPLVQQARLAVVPTMDARPNGSVVCWGLLKGQGQGQDKLLVAVVAGPDTGDGWRLEDLIRSTSTVQLKCGNDVVTLDPNRDVCVLGPRSYVTAQPATGSTRNPESLALVGVWHDAGSSAGAGGWHLYAQIKSYGRMGSAPTFLIGATQLYPLGPRANKYDSQPATSLVQALKVPEGKESYVVREARAMDEDWAIEDYPRFAAFAQPLAAYAAAVGNTHKVTDVQDTSPGSKDITNVYTTKLTEDHPEFQKN